jgi:hypothetical protein
LCSHYCTHSHTNCKIKRERPPLRQHDGHTFCFAFLASGPKNVRTIYSTSSLSLRTSRGTLDALICKGGADDVHKGYTPSARVSAEGKK